MKKLERGQGSTVCRDILLFSDILLSVLFFFHAMSISVSIINIKSIF